MNKVEKKALNWLSKGDVGLSSMTIFHCLIGTEKFDIDIPHDPSDFGRCYQLLNDVPEWKNELYKLKPLSKAWSNLIDNWDKLTEMYEENLKNNFNNHKEIGMYEFMRKLIS